MKIEVTKRGSRKYYNEFLYVASYYRKFLKKPNKKTYGLTNYLLVYNLFVLLFIGIAWLIYLNSKDKLYIFFIGMLFLLFMFVLLYNIMANKRIKQYMSSKGTKTIDINSNGIEYADEGKNFRVKWKELAYVLINKYSICFLPNTKTNVIISISTTYRKEVMEALEKYNKVSLLIDNVNNN